MSDTFDFSKNTYIPNPNCMISTGTLTLGSMHVSTGSNTAPWPNSYTYTTTDTASGPINIGTGGTLDISGPNADIKINGKSLTEMIEKINERLNILTPNLELEKEWDELRRLGQRYRQLEKKFQQKSEVWNKLKSVQKP